MKMRKLFALGALIATLVVAIPVHLSIAEAKGLVFNFGTDTSDSAMEREVLWLARAVNSETKNRKAGEMAMIACVIRNRVESNFRGATTYEEVVRAKNQFSGLNFGDRNYLRNISLDFEDTDPNWRNALRVAEVIYQTGDLICPVYFPETVRHFYSPVSMNFTPTWAKGEKPVQVIGEELATARFVFYDGIK